MAVSQVLFLCAQTMPISHNRCNHMTISHEDRSIRLVHDSRGMVPLPKFGLLARGVYPFHFFCFQKNSSLWHFQGTRSISMKDLASFPRRQQYKDCCPPLQMARTLRASQHRASLDFPQLM